MSKPLKILTHLKLVSHWEATISRLVGDKGLRYKRNFLTFFTLRSHWTLYLRHIFTLKKVVRHSRKCLTTVMRHSLKRPTTVRHLRQCLATVVRYSCKRLTAVVRHSYECLTTFLRILISFISRKSQNGLIYVTYFVALCRSRKVPCDVFANVCKGLATGSGRVCDICDDLAMVLR